MEPTAGDLQKNIQTPHGQPATKRKKSESETEKTENVFTKAKTKKDEASEVPYNKKLKAVGDDQSVVNLTNTAKSAGKRKPDFEDAGSEPKRGGFLSKVVGNISSLTSRVVFGVPKDQPELIPAEFLEELDEKLAENLLEICKGFYVDIDKEEGVNLVNLIITTDKLSEGSKLKLVKLLLYNGIPLNFGNERIDYPLHVAVQNNSSELVNFLIGHYVDPAVKDSYGNTALHYARSKEVVDALVNANCEVYYKNIYEMTPLQWACTRDNVDGAKALLEAARDLSDRDPPVINEQDWTGRTALHMAVSSKNLDLVKLLLDYGADLTIKDENGYTPLHFASSEETVNALIKDGANVNEKANDGKTALHLACANNNKEAIDALIKNGASVDEKDDEGNTPLSYADKETIDALRLSTESHRKRKTSYDEESKKVARTEPSMVFHIGTSHANDKKRKSKDDLESLEKVQKKGFLSNMGDKFASATEKLLFGEQELPEFSLVDSVETFIVSGDVEAAMRLIESDSLNENFANQEGGKLLQLVISSIKINNNDKLRLASILIQHKAPLEVTNKLGQTLIHLAVLNDDTALVNLLIEHRADCNRKDQFGNTPLHYASSKEAVNALIKANVKVNDKNHDGMTPLHLASRNNKMTVVDALIMENSNANDKDEKGRTALHYARSKKVVDALINAKAKVDDKDNDGRSALHLACMNYHIEAVDALIAHYPNQEQADQEHLDQVPLKLIDPKDNNGMTPLHLATQNGYKEVAEILLRKGAKVNEKNGNGNTTLEIASLSNHPKLFTLMVINGGDYR